MANPDRLTGLDASFLHLEADGLAHMHVAGIYVFDGPAPAYDDLVAHLVSRLDLVPRYRQRLAEAPLGQGRPVWVDDPPFSPRYHVRPTAPAPPSPRAPPPAPPRCPHGAGTPSSSGSSDGSWRSSSIATSRCGRCGWS